MLAIFGPGAKELIFSGDAVADRQRRARFLKAYDEKNRLVQQGNNMVLVIGNKDWPFPIPVIKKSESWVFDLHKAKKKSSIAASGRTSWMLRSRSPMSTPSASTPRRIATARGTGRIRSEVSQRPGQEKWPCTGKLRPAKNKALSDPLPRAPCKQGTGKTKRAISPFPIVAIITNSHRPGQERSRRRLQLSS